MAKARVDRNGQLEELALAAVNEMLGSFMSLVAAIKSLSACDLSAGEIQRTLAVFAESAPGWDGPIMARRVKAQVADTFNKLGKGPR